MIRFLTLISQYFTVLVSDCQYWVSDHIISESICLNFSRYQTFYPYYGLAITLPIRKRILMITSTLIGEMTKTASRTGVFYTHRQTWPKALAPSLKRNTKTLSPRYPIQIFKLPVTWDQTDQITWRTCSTRNRTQPELHATWPPTLETLKLCVGGGPTFACLQTFLSSMAIITTSCLLWNFWQSWKSSLTSWMARTSIEADWWNASRVLDWPRRRNQSYNDLRLT